MTQQNEGIFTSPSGKTSYRVPLALTTLAILIFPWALSAITPEPGKTDGEWRTLLQGKLDAGVMPEDIVDMSGSYRVGIEARSGSTVSWIACADRGDEDLSFKAVVGLDRQGKVVTSDLLSGPEQDDLRALADRFCAQVKRVHDEVSG